MDLIKGKRKADGSYDVPLLQRILKPNISGNDINGLGETEKRRPSPIYHHLNVLTLKPPFHFLSMLGVFIPTKKTPFYALNLLFVLRDNRKEYFGEMMKTARSYSRKLKPKSRVKGTKSPVEWKRLVEEKVSELGADKVGITDLKDEYIFTEYEKPSFSHVIVFAKMMNHDTMMKMHEEGDSVEAGVHVIEVYNECADIAIDLANWIRSQGYEAKPNRGGLATEVNILPAAIESGIGVLGKHGSLISKELGSNFRLGYVLTNLPVEYTETEEDFGAEDTCINCKLCEKSCPPDAIYSEKQMVRGEEKWYVDFDKCMPYFNDANSCGICIAVCPWSRPGVAPNLAEKMIRKKARAMEKSEAGLN